MSNCRLCGGSFSSPPNPAFDICGQCAYRTGVVPMPPGRRPMKPCGRCNATQFIRAIPREYTADGGDHSSERVAPMTVTAAPTQRERLFFGGYEVTAPNITSLGRGLLEMYICTHCGVVEWYCCDPQSVPIGPEYMTELVDVTPDSPYR